MIRYFDNHEERVGAVSVIDDYLITGSWDRKILFYDLWENRICK